MKRRASVLLASVAAVVIVARYAVLAQSNGAPAAPAPAQLDGRFTTVVRPFLQTYCVTCHGGDNPEAQLDLRTYSSMAAVLRDGGRWGLVLERLKSEEMPAPEADKFPPPSARRQVVEWFQALRDDEIRHNAGDPGIVLARRLSHSEYNYTIRDLTGIDIRPTREFPADPSNTAGFDNSGESLTMSPALLNKYLRAAHDVANHMFLRPRGISFAPNSMLSETDRDQYCVQQIVDFYHRQNTDYLDYFEAAWGFKHRVALGQPTLTLAGLAAQRQVSSKYLATIWSTLEGSRETVGPLATVQSMWRALPAPGANRLDTAGSGREALRDFVVQLRKKIEPRFVNITAGGVGAGAQPLLIWKNVQYATHRMMFDPAQLQVAGEDRPPASPASMTPEPGSTGAFGPGATRLVTNVPGDPDLAVPAGERARYEAAFAKFARVFPDMFYMEERGRNYFDTTKDRGRYLNAGFHSLMGYFRDDQPLYELLLSDTQQAQLDDMWLEMDFVASTTSRMYAQFYENGSRQGGGGAIALPEYTGPKDEDVTSETKIKILEAAYQKAAGTGEARGIAAVTDYFEWVNDRLRSVERARIAAEPSHLDALLRFAARAYRRPLSHAEKDDVIGYYRSSRRNDGLSHEAAMRESMVGVLMSPDLVFRLDRMEPGQGVHPLSDYALASRLSYFLWSSLPDDALLAHAAAGDLHQPRVIATEARRMLKDPRARALAVEFGGGWLDFRRFEDLATVDRERFASFTNELRQAMFEEPIRFMLDVFQKNRPVLDLLYAGDTFVNPVLARHYGMPAIGSRPDEWVQITDARPFDRGGLLPMAAFLTKNAPGLRTSPVKRGNWVVKNVLGERISPPPPGVPQLPRDETKLDLPLRDMMVRHRADPTCAACHAKFDALGLVFEGYGPIGERRDKDLANRPIDASATFPGGGKGAGVEGLRTYIRDHRQNDFVDNLGGKLLAYALGRSLMVTDGPTIQAMRKKLADDGYQFDSLIESIVTSRQFLTRRGSPDLAER